MNSKNVNVKLRLTLDKRLFHYKEALKGLEKEIAETGISVGVCNLLMRSIGMSKFTEEVDDDAALELNFPEFFDNYKPEPKYGEIPTAYFWDVEDIESRIDAVKFCIGKVEKLLTIIDSKPSGIEFKEGCSNSKSHVLTSRITKAFFPEFFLKHDSGTSAYFWSVTDFQSRIDALEEIIAELKAQQQQLQQSQETKFFLPSITLYRKPKQRLC